MPEAMTIDPSQSSCEKATPVSRNHRKASKVTVGERHVVAVCCSLRDQ
jgi:hypothetical protein